VVNAQVWQSPDPRLLSAATTASYFDLAGSSSSGSSTVTRDLERACPVPYWVLGVPELADRHYPT
jgi:hypothetical protein